MLCLCSSQLVIVLCCVIHYMLHFLFGGMCVNLRMDFHLKPLMFLRWVLERSMKILHAQVFVDYDARQRPPFSAVWRQTLLRLN